MPVWEFRNPVRFEVKYFDEKVFAVIYVTTALV